MKTVVITGANRGIGLAMAKQFKARGYHVFAICRQPSVSLNELMVSVVAGVDVTTQGGQQLLQQSLKDITIDILINNAGILRDESLGSINSCTIVEQFKVNALAPLEIVDLLHRNLTSGSKIALITSRMGSIADNDSGGRYGYRMSKAALNAAGMSLARDLMSEDISVGIYHPGWVQTDMVAGSGHITADVAAQRLTTLILQQDITQTGVFKHSNGEILPW